MNNYYVYAIKSDVYNRIYVGMSRNPDKILKEHNLGQVKSTRPYMPWKIIYKKFIGSRAEAREEEKKMKSGYGKEFLKTL